MKFKLSGYLTATKKVEDSWVEEIIGNLKKERILERGAPEGEGAKIEEWKTREDKIHINISSGRYVRPHDAVFRLRNYLAREMGKKRKIGVRDIFVERYEIELELDDLPAGEVSLPFATVEINRKEKKARLVLQNLDEEFIKGNAVDRVIKRFCEKVRASHTGGKKEFSRLIEKSAEKEHKLGADPTREMIDRGWVKEFPGAGIWIIMPPYACLIRAMYDLCIDEAAKKLGFEEIMLPRLIPLEVERKKGHLNIANEQFWVCPPVSRNPKDFEDYSDLVEITRKPLPEKLKEKLKEPMFGLAYAQCEPFYQIFEGEISDAERLWKVYDINGPTWRWEGGGLKGLERLNEFHRIEFVFIGTPEEVVKTRDMVLEESKRVLEDVLDLQWKVDATTAVYLEHAGKTEEEDDQFVKTYDLSAILPFKTQSREEAELEIASFHVHKDFYAKRFHWKEKKNRELWSGCAGIGPTRWAFTFLARHGFEFEDWPQAIRERIRKLPQVPRFENWPRVE